MPKAPQVADDVTVRIGRSRPMGVNPGNSNTLPAPPSTLLAAPRATTVTDQVKDEANDTLSHAGSVVHPNVPEYKEPPLRGILRVHGAEVPLQSGRKGPGEYLAELPAG